MAKPCAHGREDGQESSGNKLWWRKLPPLKRSHDV